MPRHEPHHEPQPASLRERHKESTRRSLEDAALRLFAERGYDATTIEAIAEVAGVSPRTFFRYFAAKDEVLDMGWHERQAQLVSVGSTAPVELDDLGAAAWLLRAMSASFAAERERLRQRGTAALRSPTLRGRVADSLTAWESTVAGVLASRRGEGRPAFGDHVVAATAVAVWTTAIGHWLGDDDADLVAVVDEAFAHLGRSR